ncbi:MAG: hypothetical protein ACLR0U_05280 [Enterocloster clostridioformis]
MDRGYFMELGRINKDVEVRLEAGDDGSPTLQAEVWRFNPQALEAVYGKMNRNPHGAVQVDGYGAVRQHYSGYGRRYVYQHIPMIRDGLSWWTADGRGAAEDV